MISATSFAQRNTDDGTGGGGTLPPPPTTGVNSACRWENGEGLSYAVTSTGWAILFDHGKEYSSQQAFYGTEKEIRAHVDAFMAEGGFYLTGCVN